MADCLTLLDQALDVGHKELDSIAAGDVDAVSDLAKQRSELVEQAWTQKDCEPVDVNVLLTKLRRLRTLQGQLTSEAKRLHASLRDDLLRVKRESHRMQGYGKSSKVTPLYGRSMLHKRG